MNNRISVATIDSPEFINLQTMDINPLMSKCDVKVLYVGQNRNRSCITKEIATKMSKTLRGCPIVGYYIENKEDFGDHGDQVIIDGEGVKFKKLTKPYGFVAPDAKVWFQFFEDQDEFGNTCVREYLMTEGYLWTGQFEECQRVLENNNPQSMELDEKTLKGYWSTDNNKGVDFFIINDAVFSKLCILGDDVEPCFEGANVSAPNLSSTFSKNDDFTKSLFTMMSELKFALDNSKGGKPMLNEIQNELDNGVESTSFENQTNVENPSVKFEDESTETNESTESGAPTDTPSAGEGDNTTNAPVAGETGANEGTTTEEPNEDENEEQTTDVSSDDVTSKAVIKKILQNAKNEDEEEKKKDESEKTDDSKNEDNTEDDKKKEDKKDEDKEEKKKFSLEEQLSNLQVEFEKLQAENAELLAFKKSIEDKEKDELIASFYMLSDEDKKNVIENKANYSLKEIKAELSIMCVDKKINFTENTDNVEVPVTFNVNAVQPMNDLPAWLQAVEDRRNSDK